MTDELEALRAALRASPPPDPGARARAMAQAMENFDRRQGSAAEARQGKDRPWWAGILDGVRGMQAFLSSRFLLATGGSVAALGLALVLVLPQADRLRSPQPASPALPGAVPDAAPETAPAKVLAEPVAEPMADALAAKPAPISAPLPAPAPNAAAKRAMGVAAPVGQGERAEARKLAPPAAEGEHFANAPQTPVQVAAEQPVSTFSIDVDTASYALVRQSLRSGNLPPPDAVRVEEMVNYFPYGYPAPTAEDAPFRPTVSVVPTPWNPDTRLVHIALQGRLPAIADRPALNLVFLIDTSGSMQDPAKLPLLKQSLGLMMGRLRPQDQVAIVAYAGSAGQVLAPTPASERDRILDALDRLDAGGSTAGAEGLELAYRTAATMPRAGRVSRVILATDGDFNVGVSDPDQLRALIARERDGGTYLSVLGFGRGNLQDATMQALAQTGNGQAAYIDTLSEAQKVLVDQLSGALFPIADDVKVQVEWNPARVAEYRLIGYETRALAREDFANDKVDAGEIGAGHSVTAIYEVTPTGSPARLTDPLRYGAEPVPVPEGHGDELGFLKLRYKAPGESASHLIETPVPATGTAPSEDVRFGVAIAGFGQLLRGSDRLGNWGWDQAVALAEGARGADPFGYRTEAVQLMRLAQSLSR